MTYMTVHNNRQGLNRMFDRFFDEWFTTPAQEADFSPKVNIHETSDNVTLTIEVPGIKKDDIKVTVNDDVLTISGKRQFEHEEKDNVYLRREIDTGEFSRSFTLPDTVDADKIAADYNNGLLEIKLARREETKPKEIEVKVS